MIVNLEHEARPDPGEPLVEVSRGRLIEAVHRGSVAVVDASGSLSAAVGDPWRTRTYWRSSAKPFQAIPVVSSGAAARWRLSSEELAIISASHSGEPVHVAHVSALLDRIGCDVDDLVCGAHPPLSPQASSDLQTRGVQPSALHNNCSGKHAGMLALARHLGADIDGYEQPSHPVQREILATVSRFSGLPADEITVGVDGCGVPCFGTSVAHMALAFARLMDDSSAEEPYASAARAVRAAMTEHPLLVAGTGRLDTDLMRLGAGAILAKGGASGVQCVGLRGGLGIAVKLEDGADSLPTRPSGVALIEALRSLDVLDSEQVAALGEHARPVLRTIAGREVGEVRPVFTLAGP